VRDRNLLDAISYLSEPLILETADGGTIVARHKGKIRIRTTDGRLINLNDAYYSDQLSSNLISNAALADKGAKIHFDKDQVHLSF
jgi:hypothetical protein